jgi:dephospho-CoA kinase
VVDAALLYETAWDALCDSVLFVAAPIEQRRQRALQRGWPAEQFAAREASQWPVEQKQSRAAWIVDNSGEVEDINPQVERILEQLGLPGRPGSE